MPYAIKRSIFSDSAVQTEDVGVGADLQGHVQERIKADMHEDQESTLSASDLASILKWSKDISSDINLASGESAALIMCLVLTAVQLYSDLQR